jgi:hypothetical protein
MTTYLTHAVLLKPIQKELLLRAVTERTGAVIRIPQYAISDPTLGSDPSGDMSPLGGGSVRINLPLTKHQVKRFGKNTKLDRGVDLKLSKAQVKVIKRHGVGDLMGIPREGEGIKDVLKHTGKVVSKVGRHALGVAGKVGKKLEPVLIDLVARAAERKLKEQFGAGTGKKKALIH